MQRPNKGLKLVGCAQVGDGSRAAIVAAYADRVRGIGGDLAKAVLLIRPDVEQAQDFDLAIHSVPRSQREQTV